MPSPEKGKADATLLAGEQGKAAAGKLHSKSNEKDPPKIPETQVSFLKHHTNPKSILKGYMCLSHLEIHPSGAT